MSTLRSAALASGLIVAGVAQGCFLPVTQDLPTEARRPTGPELDVANQVLLDVDADPRFPYATRGCTRKTSDWWIAVVDADTWDRYCWAPDGQRDTCVREAAWGHHSVRRRKYQAPLIVHYEGNPRIPIRHDFGHVIRSCLMGYADHWHADDPYWELIDHGAE